MPQAPVRTKPAPQAPPSRTAPSPKRKKVPNPFRPRKPKDLPNPEPKNYVIFLMESYEDNVARSTQDFWTNLDSSDHPFKSHPVLSKHGDKMSREGWQDVSDRMDKLGMDVHDSMKIFQQIFMIEQAHKEQLQNLAIKAVAQVWGFPEEQLRAFLGPEVDTPGDGGEGPEELAVDDELQKQIHKRMTMNSLTHGSAIHNMMTLHHIVNKELNNIDPNLLDLYGKLAAGAHGQYWMHDIAAMLNQLAGMAAGSSVIDWDQIHPDDDSPTPTVVAKAVAFPVLVQELSKGIMEILTYHQFSDMDASAAHTVMKHADSMNIEPYLEQVGPAIWRRFLKVVNSIDGVTLPQVISALSVQDPDEVHGIIVTVVGDTPDEAGTLLKDLVIDPEEFTIDDYEDEFGGPEYDLGEPTY